MLDKILGTASAAVNPITAVGNVLDSLFTSDEERLSKKVIMQRLALEPGKAQVELNKVEASHRSIFVAGWRPFTGWVCGVGLLYYFLLHPILAWLVAIFAPEVEAPPLIDIAELSAILLGMLGLGFYRTIEKGKGISK